jgi:hypothetical protein
MHELLLLLAHGPGCDLKISLCGEFCCSCSPFAQSPVQLQTLIAWEALFLELRSVILCLLRACPLASSLTPYFILELSELSMDHVFPSQPSVGFLFPFRVSELITSFGHVLLFGPHSRHARRVWTPLVYVGMSFCYGQLDVFGLADMFVLVALFSVPSLTSRLCMALFVGLLARHLPPTPLRA